MRHAAGNMQRTANMQRATGNMRQTSSNMQRTTPSCTATCSMQHATGNVRHATGILQTTIDNRQQGNEAARNTRHAADTAQKTAKPDNACNRQRATDSG
jgi:hypothetical protein